MGRPRRIATPATRSTRASKRNSKVQARLTDSQIVQQLEEDDTTTVQEQSNNAEGAITTSIRGALDASVPVPGSTAGPASVPSSLSSTGNLVFELEQVIEAGWTESANQHPETHQPEQDNQNMNEPSVDSDDNQNLELYSRDLDSLQKSSPSKYHQHATNSFDSSTDSSVEITSEHSDISIQDMLDSDVDFNDPGEPKTKKRKLTTNRRVNKNNAGRNQDPIWEHFDVKMVGDKIISTKCKTCTKPVSARAPRLRQHGRDCFNRHKYRDESVPVESQETASVPSSSAQNKKLAKKASSKITNFMDRMLQTEKAEIDNLLGKLVFSCNLPFSIVENAEFINFVKRLRPAYDIPNERTLGSKILDKIHDECTSAAASVLNDAKVTIQQDGWSTRQNAPVIAHSISTGTRNYFISAEATETNTKTAAYCQKLLEAEIENVEQKYKCKVIGSVTDNCATMRRMREDLALERPDLFIYGCHSHLLNLVGQELTPDKLKADVVEVQKFFRNHHYSAASLKKKQGNRPVLPGDTRWNSQLDCFKSFLDNQAKYLEISREEGAKMPESIKSLIRDNDFYEEVKQANKILLPVAIALDKLQGDKATLGDAVSLWLALKKDLGHYNENHVFKEKYKMAMTPIAVAAYMLHPKYRGLDLPIELKNAGDAFLAARNPLFVVSASELKIKSPETFPRALLDEQIVSKMNPSNWWKSVGVDVRLPIGLVDLATNLMTLPSSTGGLERSFSVLGRILTAARSRLGVEKASKLCFVYSYLKSKDVETTFFNDSDLD